MIHSQQSSGKRKSFAAIIFVEEENDCFCEELREVLRFLFVLRTTANDKVAAITTIKGTKLLFILICVYSNE